MKQTIQERIDQTIGSAQKIADSFLGMISHSGNGIDLATKKKKRMIGLYTSSFYGTFAVDTTGKKWRVHRTYGANHNTWTFY